MTGPLSRWRHALHAAREMDPDERRAVWMLASLLLDYPDETRSERLTQATRILSGVVADLPDDVRVPLRRALTRLCTAAPEQAAVEYVDTFDHTRRCSLYLTYYSAGDTRRRGGALLAIQQTYRAAGVTPPADELPDHLAVVLEFGATVDPEAGRRLLLDHRAGLELLRLALTDEASPYADVLTAVCATLPPLRGDERDAVARFAAQGPPGEQVGRDGGTAGGAVALPDPVVRKAGAS